MDVISGVLMYGHHVVGTGHHHSGGLFGDLGSTIAHAAIWSIVGRALFRAPMAVVVIVGVLAVLWFVARARRSQR